jgi:hypothetical protein
MTLQLAVIQNSFRKTFVYQWQNGCDEYKNWSIYNTCASPALAEAINLRFF